MKRKLIGLAIIGLASGNASAQSNVTIYGILDAVAGVGKAGNVSGNQTQMVVNSGGLSGSRLGFRGEEALGNGLKAVFTLELGSLDITGATNSIGNTRQAFVGLSSERFGTMRLGRTQTFAYDFSIKYDPFAASNAFSPLASLNKGLIAGNTSSGRQQNAISYISPAFGGVTFRGDIAVGEQVTGTNGATGYNKAQSYLALGADYDNGPLAMGLVFAELDDKGGTLNNANTAGTKDWALAGRYNFGAAQPYLWYQESKAVPTTGTSIKTQLWSTGVHIPVGDAGKIKLAYVNTRNDLASAKVKAQGWGIDYEHSLSSRTTAYVGYQSIANGTNAKFVTSNASDPTASNGKSASFYGVGLRHTF